MSSEPPEITICDAQSGAEIELVRALMRDYGASLDVDLSFQDFEAELAALPGAYASPEGALVMALVNGLPAGCCALRPINEVDYPNACEMKRLYVSPVFRGFGLGRMMVERILSIGRAEGYTHMLLDTLDEMEAARALYRDTGFEEVDAYYYNPLPGTRYLAAKLQAS